MSLRGAFHKPYKVGEEITKLSFYGVYYGHDGRVRALIHVDGKIIKGFMGTEIGQQLVPNLILPSIDYKLHIDLHAVCVLAKEQCALAEGLQLPKTGGLYILGQDGNYTPQPWPPGYNPQRQSGLTLG
ncbi:MAG: hypothetical protein JNK24_04835 [Alphaproteobacteria bacterium]|nr:hypothetical protein [Alphaproteobacteria bacterium]